MKRLRQMSSGFLFGFKGWRFLLTHPKLWLWALFPTFINLALMIGLLSFLLQQYPLFSAWLHGLLDGLLIYEASTWWGEIWAGFLAVLATIIKLLVSVFALMLLVMLFYFLGFIIAAPFNDILSEKTEELVTGKKAPSLAWRNLPSHLWRTIKTEIQKLLFFLSAPLILFVIQLLPGIGPIFYTVSCAAFSAFDLGYNYADLALARKWLSFRDRLNFARKNALTLAGFGLPLLIPFSNFFLMSGYVVGGTLLTLSLEPSTAQNHVFPTLSTTPRTTLP